MNEWNAGHQTWCAKKDSDNLSQRDVYLNWILCPPKSQIGNYVENPEDFTFNWFMSTAKMRWSYIVDYDSQPKATQNSLEQQNQPDNIWALILKFCLP